MFELTNVTVTRGDAQVLRDLTLTLTQQRIGVIGANGSGKSTFARLLNGLQLPTQGKVRVGDDDTKADGQSVRRKVGFVFQNPDSQIVMPTVEEDIGFGLRNLGLDKVEVSTRTNQALDRFQMTHLRQQAAHTLSGGEKQMLALAGVLAMTPQAIVFDEPTTLLDLRNTRRFQQAVAQLDQKVVLVTHDLTLLDDFDRVLVFDKGQVAFDAAPADAIAAYQDMMSDA